MIFNDMKKLNEFKDSDEFLSVEQQEKFIQILSQSKYFTSKMSSGESCIIDRNFRNQKISKKMKLTPILNTNKFELHTENPGVKALIEPNHINIDEFFSFIDSL